VAETFSALSELLSALLVSDTLPSRLNIAANAIYQARVTSGLDAVPDLSPADKKRLLETSLDGLNMLSPSALGLVRTAYSNGLRMVFVSFTAVSGIALTSSFFIKVSV